MTCLVIIRIWTQSNVISAFVAMYLHDCHSYLHSMFSRTTNGHCKRCPSIFFQTSIQPSYTSSIFFWQYQQIQMILPFDEVLCIHKSTYPTTRNRICGMDCCNINHEGWQHYPLATLDWDPHCWLVASCYLHSLSSFLAAKMK